MCAPTVREQRAADIDTACTEWARRPGCSVWFITATVPHRRTDELVDTMEQLQSVWSWAWSGAAAKDLRESLGIKGTIRAWDHTLGRNGWHPHFHGLLFIDTSDGFGWFDPTLVIDRLRESWAMHGIADQWVPNVSVQLEPVHTREAVGRYTAKVQGGWGAGLELARSDLKRGHGISPWQLQELAQHGEAFAVRQWCAYERATKGRRFIVWSPGLRDLVGLGEELTDEEAAEGPAAEQVAATYTVEQETWNRYRLAGQLAVLLDRLERGEPTLGVYVWDPPPPT